MSTNIINSNYVSFTFLQESEEYIKNIEKRFTCDVCESKTKTNITAHYRRIGAHSMEMISSEWEWFKYSEYSAEFRRLSSDQIHQFSIRFGHVIRDDPFWNWHHTIAWECFRVTLTVRYDLHHHNDHLRVFDSHNLMQEKTHRIIKLIQLSTESLF